MTELTQEYLKRRLHYDPDTGVFTWLAGNMRGMTAGSPNIKGYICISMSGNFYAHRLAWLYMRGSFPVGCIDHINQDKSDNRMLNLRCGDHSLNSKNRGMQSNNSSGVNGVSWDRKRRKWDATIKVNGRKIRLGRFANKDDAVNARASANFEYGFSAIHGL